MTSMVNKISGTSCSNLQMEVDKKMVQIGKEKCIACGTCIPYCPMGAIHLEDVAVIDQDECVECGVCIRAGMCPVDAFSQEMSPYPRSVRAVFSDPTAVHAGTGIAGRGTEEMKTNDVTGRFKLGYVGVGFEFGRPGIGTRFHDVEKIAKVIAKVGGQFEAKNPVTQLMKDVNTGEFKEEILNEKVMSAIIECLVPIDKFKELMSAVKEASKEVDTVFSVDCITRVAPDDSLPIEPILAELGIEPRINGKTNVGLGKPVAEGV